MIIKSNLVRICILSTLVILFPLVQNQWLNLYLFDKNSFTIFKLLYYLSGLLIPILVCINSLNNFTFYKFSNNKKNNNLVISGKSLLIITFIALITLSTLILSYFIINFKLYFSLIISDNNYLINFDFNKYILYVGIISILLLFKKVKLIIKRITLINFFMISIIIWYLKINNILFENIFLLNNLLKFENINYISIIILLCIEIIYYIWSYISYSSYLSDWKMPLPNLNLVFLHCFNIIYFYLMIILYYSILSS